MNRWISAYEGSLAADALAMPVHWYYDPAALQRDYGPVDCFKAPRNPHPGSILWRSQYTALNARGDILREQADFWGQREIHYHQFLKAGENTLNFQLAVELFTWTKARGSYDPDAWLEHYIERMLERGWHRDTYVEAGDWISGNKAESWRDQPDTQVVGARFSPACYIAEAMPAALYLTWKYHNDFTAGIIANASVGGDNCHRGAVVGSLLGAACGSIPQGFTNSSSASA